jgi:hypothetical protein
LDAYEYPLKDFFPTNSIQLMDCISQLESNYLEISERVLKWSEKCNKHFDYNEFKNFKNSLE